MSRNFWMCVAAALLIPSAAGASAPEPEALPTCPSPQQTAPLQGAGGANISTRSAVVWNGREYGVVWGDSTDNRLHFRRIFADGTPAAPAVTVSTLDSYPSYAPSLVWNGSGYGVTWMARTGLYYQAYFARLDANGALLGAEVKVSFVGTTETVTATYPALAFGGNGYAVVWYDPRDSVTANDIFATLLNADGTIAGAGGLHDILLCNASGNQCSPTVAWSRGYGRYLIAWDDARSGTKSEIYGATLNPSDGTTDPTGTLVSGSANSYWPWLADMGNGVGLVWHDNRDGNYEIYFARLTAIGEKLGADLRVTNEPNPSLYPVLLWTGAEFGLFWQDFRTGNIDLWFQRVTASGALAGTNAPVTFTTGTGSPHGAFGRYGYLGTGACYHGANYVQAWGCAADATPPTCPLNLVAYNVTATAATVAWVPSVEDATDLAYYEVYRNSGLVARTSDARYSDSGLSLNTTYNYYVRPVNAAQLVNGSCSSSSSIYVKTNASLTLRVDKSAPDALLTWSDAALNNYNVFRGTSPQVMQQIGNTAGCSFTDPSVLSDGVAYFYTVDEPGQ